MLMAAPGLEIKLPLKKLSLQFDRSSSKTCHPSLENRNPHTIFHIVLPQEENKSNGVCLGYSDYFPAANSCVFKENLATTINSMLSHLHAHTSCLAQE